MSLLVVHMLFAYVMLNDNSNPDFPDVKLWQSHALLQVSDQQNNIELRTSSSSKDFKLHYLYALTVKA
jgi:hypothetical protein